jgi:hypothetical protein
VKKTNKITKTTIQHGIANTAGASPKEPEDERHLVVAWKRLPLDNVNQFLMFFILIKYFMS